MNFDKNHGKELFEKFGECENLSANQEKLSTFDGFLIMNDTLPSQFAQLEQMILADAQVSDQMKETYKYLCECREKTKCLLELKAMNMGKQINDKVLFREYDKINSQQEINKHKVSIIVEDIKSETNIKL